MEFVVTIHSRNAHLRPSTVDYASICALQQALGMRKCCYYEQLEAVNRNFMLNTLENCTLVSVVYGFFYKINNSDCEYPF